MKDREAEQLRKVPVTILTGFLGSGKTTLAKQIAARHRESILVQHFDAIPVPTLEEMTALHGSPEEWQRRKTHDWMSKLATLTASRILFEGQCRIEYLVSALNDAGLHHSKVVLVDCSDEERTQRLMHSRRQPELANDGMLQWAAYLRAEALEFGCEILDTSRSTTKECVDRIVAGFHWKS